eukprot:366370_1
MKLVIFVLVGLLFCASAQKIDEPNIVLTDLEAQWVDDTYQFFLGFMEGLLKDNFKEVKDCLVGAKSAITKIVEGFKLIFTWELDKIWRGILLICAAIGDIDHLIDDCILASQAVVEMFQVFQGMSFKDWTDMVAKNVLKHGWQIAQLVIQATTAVADDDWNELGKCIGG